VTELLPEDKLNLCIDLSHLSSFVALNGARHLAGQFGIELNWLPLVKLSARSTGKVQVDDPLGEYKARRARAKKMFADRELERVSVLLGISAENGQTQFDPTAASEGLILLKEADASQQVCWHYVEAIYSAAFRKNQPIETSDQVASVLNSLDIVLPEKNDTSRKLAEIQAALLEAGIFDSPTFVYQGERYLGRQHLPLLNWILGGRKGVPPV
jgi:2-hydroxychromene-2-carboxylate isomerase